MWNGSNVTRPPKIGGINLAVMRETIPKEWKNVSDKVSDNFRVWKNVSDKVSDNFRVMTHKNFRVFKEKRYKLKALR